MPAGCLVEAAGGQRSSIDVPGAGPCQVQTVALESQPPTTLFLARAEGPFSAEEVTLLRSMGRVLMLAVQPLRQLEVERRLRRRSELQTQENARLLASLRERQTVLERLNGIQQAISHRSPAKVIYDAVVGGAAEIVNGDIAALRLGADDDRNVVRIAASCGLSDAVVADLEGSPMHEGVGGRAMREQRLVVSTDYAGMEHAVPRMVAEGVRAAMAAPVYRDGKVAGSLVVATRRAQTFTVEQQEILLAFAEHASLALNDASALEAMRAAYGDAVHQANHDALTGLPNRTMVLDRLGDALQRGAREGHGVVVLFIDLDRFKTINDSFGHAIGDEVLIRVAERLGGAVRAGDMVGRLAGDEFVAICSDLGDVAALQLAERVAEAVSAPLPLYGRDAIITVSIGLAHADCSRPADEVLRDADVAMYRAKQRGRSRIELFDEQMRTRILARLQTEHALRGAVARAELAVHYQPIVDVRTRKVVGVEALVRWDRPGIGLVGPDEFIPIAEEAGLIVPIGVWVLREACRQVADWRSAHGELAALQLSVNLSSRQFTDPGLIDAVTAALAWSQLPAGSLTLEITESAFMEDAEATGDALRALTDLGLRLSIDDFGTGYSSLAYLKRFPVSELKVDRSFVDGLSADTEDLAIVAAVIELARALSLDVIAEGVETPAQHRLLVELGCRTAQGYLYGRPRSAEDSTEVLLARQLQRCAG
jgi:diguanylate cyclase (GGDEF)-like protein